MITLKQAKIGYGRIALFPPLSGHFITGSLTAVIGVNGAGKSTLLKTLAGLQKLQGGSLHFNTNDLPHIAYLAQQTEFDRQFPILVSDLVAMGNWKKNGIFGGLSRHALQHIIQALECVGMTAMTNRPVGELSSGQLQRVLFARLLVQQAPLILLDEPFSGIDRTTTALLLQVIKQLHQKGRTLITVLHDMSMVTNHFPQVLLLTQQYYKWGDTHQVLEHIQTLHTTNQPACQIAIAP
ncbi:metal ABC transporter ATP-binding protein [Candidatus Gillettellia adelgis]